MKDLKKSRRGNIDPESVKKALEFSKSLLAKREIIVKSNMEED